MARTAIRREPLASFREPGVGLPSARRAAPPIEAIREGLSVREALSSEGRGWRDITVSLWDVEEIDEYRIPAMGELLVGLHTGGRPVRTRVGSAWSPPSAVGRLHLVPATAETTWNVHGSLRFIAVHVGDARLRGLTERSDEAATSLSRLDFRFGFVDPFVASAVTELFAELRDPREQGSLYVDLLADTLLVHVLRSAAPALVVTPRGGLSNTAWRLVRDRVEERLSESLTIEELAREAGLSRFHFARAFKKATGLSPHRYVTLRRVERAKSLLSHSDLPLVNVALEVGFSNQAHFTDQFHRVTGSTPSAYRRNKP